MIYRERLNDKWEEENISYNSHDSESPNFIKWGARGKISGSSKQKAKEVKTCVMTRENAELKDTA